MKSKAVISFVLSVVFLVSGCFVISAEPELPDLSGIESVYVCNVENGVSLYSKNSDMTSPPASFTKMMTGLIAIEKYSEGYGDLITVTNESLGRYQGKNIGLKNTEMVTVENLLGAVICGGANDAANVLAYEIAGSHENFVNMMNAKAEELGMKNTRYTNAGGYYENGMYTTAEDTAILAKKAYMTPEYMKFCSMERYVVPETNTSKARYVYNSNYLISTNVETKYKNADTQGLNAGSTNEGGHVLATATSKNGVTNIFVMMGGTSDEKVIKTYEAVKDLVKWSYESFGYRKLLDSGEIICEVPVKLSNQVDYVVLCPEKSVEHFMPTSVDIEKEVERTVELNESSLEAPIEAGYVAGSITLSYNGEVIDKVNLVTKNNVDRNGFLYILARIQNFTKSKEFKIVILCVAAAIVIYFAAAVYRRTKSNRYRYKKYEARGKKKNK